MAITTEYLARLFVINPSKARQSTGWIYFRAHEEPNESDFIHEAIAEYLAAYRRYVKTLARIEYGFQPNSRQFHWY